MKKLLAALVVTIAACNKDSATTTTTSSATTETTTAAATATATATASATATATPSSAVGSGLPRAKDVLPAGEVSGESLVVMGDGYRFQIPPTLAASGTKYTGKVSGMIGDATLTMWVTKEPFAGDVKALAARETKDATSAGGKITESLSPAMMKTAGTMDNSHAQRFVVQLPGRYEMRELTVNHGTAYIFHCETPDVLNAWINVGSDCMIKGTTFHVAPPK